MHRPVAAVKVLGRYKREGPDGGHIVVMEMIIALEVHGTFPVHGAFPGHYEVHGALPGH